MTSDNICITLASVEDAEDILTLQRLAYRSESALHGNALIPPLMQTLDELREEFETRTFFKAVTEGRIVGSGRGHQDEHGTLHIGRLAVHPDLQGRGIGTSLLRRIEAAFPAARRFELFTGHRSERNLRLYQRLGYRVFKREPAADGVTLVFLEKMA
jgi:ribosomal protein S18 acetylase RimI-like enzyme